MLAATPSTARQEYPPFPRLLPPGRDVQGPYVTRFAGGPADLDAVERLRFEVFNLELGEGLAASYATGRDEDPFDAACHHLIVEDAREGRVVGTYRMQTSEMAAAGIGFYAAGEFDLGRLPGGLVERSVEVGRACVALSHRNRHVLFLLWRGIAAYVTWNRKRYLFGCCSLTSQNPAEGARAHARLLREGFAHPELRVEPLAGLECAPGGAAADLAEEVRLPVLFRTYLRHGALVCGPPAIDRAFGTIDFFTLLDTDAVAPDLRRLYFGSAPAGAGVPAARRRRPR
jgi:putative hemolysin